MAISEGWYFNVLRVERSVGAADVSDKARLAFFQAGKYMRRWKNVLIELKSMANSVFPAVAYFFQRLIVFFRQLKSIGGLWPKRRPPSPNVRRTLRTFTLHLPDCCNGISQAPPLGPLSPLRLQIPAVCACHRRAGLQTARQGEATRAPPY